MEAEIQIGREHYNVDDGGSDSGSEEGENVFLEVFSRAKDKFRREKENPLKGCEIAISIVQTIRKYGKAQS